MNLLSKALTLTSLLTSAFCSLSLAEDTSALEPEDQPEQTLLSTVLPDDSQPTQISFSELPQDLLVKVESLLTVKDLYNLTQINKKLHSTTQRLLNERKVEQLESDYQIALSQTSRLFSPLHIAARDGNLDLVLYIDQKEPDNFSLWCLCGYTTPAYLAALNGHFKCVIYLAERAPEAMEKRTKDRDSAVHRVATAQSWETLRIIAQQAPRALVLRNGDSIMPIQIAAMGSQWEIIELIAETLPGVGKIQDREGNTLVDLIEKNDAPTDLVNRLRRAMKRL